MMRLLTAAIVGVLVSIGAASAQTVQSVRFCFGQPTCVPVSAANPLPTTGGAGGGGAVTVADGADVAQGAIADAAYTGVGSTTVIGALKGIYAGIIGPIPTQAPTVDIGAVGISQTTPGTTNAVSVKYGTTALIADPCQSVAKTYTPISITTATTTRIIAPTAAKKTYVCYMYLQTTAANNIAIVEGTGGTCGSGTAGIVGGTTAANGLNNAANSGQAFGNGGFAALATAGTNVDLCLITSAGTPLAGHVVWVAQ